jgi:hypothetical protein
MQESIIVRNVGDMKWNNLGNPLVSLLLLFLPFLVGVAIALAMQLMGCIGD